MSNFMESLKTSLDNSDHNVSTTANGALGYRTTGSALLDLNFSVSSLRDKSNDEIIIKWYKSQYWIVAHFFEKFPSGNAHQHGKDKDINGI